MGEKENREKKKMKGRTLWAKRRERKEKVKKLKERTIWKRKEEK